MTSLSSWTVRPLTQPDRIPAGSQLSPFHSSWTSTVAVLLRELSYLRAEHVLLELEVGQHAPARVDATVLGSLGADGPCVRLSFDSRHGPLSYGTGRFTTEPPHLHIAWRLNLRAIALGLESLRRVDRYGIAPAGEQYSGWLTLPAGEPARSARELLALTGATAVTVTQVIADRGTFQSLYRAAARRHDPDAGGDVAAWARLQRARTILSDHHHQEAP